MQNDFYSCFFCNKDKQIDQFIWEDTIWDFVDMKWWSRRYEYRWGIDVSKKYFGSGISSKTFLDVGTGKKHPFMFMMKSIGFKSCNGVDLFDEDKYHYKKYLNDSIHYCAKDISQNKLGIFNCVSCISVLEHMDKSMQEKLIVSICQSTIEGGCVILTFDVEDCFSMSLPLFFMSVLEDNGVYCWKKEVSTNILCSQDNHYANDIDRQRAIYCYRIFGEKSI